ncbi:MAG TPA: hypothetical protein VH593_04530 [Ktedonobacteraceae bacterium]
MPRQFGPLQPSAKKLLECAERLVPAGWPFSPLHIVLAVLKDESGDIPSSQILNTLVDSTQLNELKGFLEYGMQHGEPPASQDGLTQKLHECIQVWCKTIAERNVLLTDTVVLWTIITQDSSITHMMKNYDIQPELVTGVLVGKFERDERHSTVQASSHFSSEEAQAYSKAEQLVQEVSPSSDYRCEHMHSLVTDGVLDVLGKSAQSKDGEIPILVGHNGSALEEVEKALADRLAANHHPFRGVRERLQEFKAVYRLALGKIHELPKGQKPGPSLVLEMAKRYALDKKAILLISQIELLHGHTELEKSLRAPLVDRGDCLILGVYTLDHHSDVSKQLSLGLPNARIHLVREYDAQDTLTFLEKFYFPQWELLGYTFEPGAFDLLMKLEPGAWIESRRRVLPYLTVDLAEDTIDTAEEGNEEIHLAAERALKEIQNLRTKELPDVREGVRKQFEGLIKQAEEEIKALSAKPSPREDAAGHKVLKSGHLLAEFFCPTNESEFHFPGHNPFEMMR